MGAVTLWASGGLSAFFFNYRACRWLRRPRVPVCCLYVLRAGVTGVLVLVTGQLWGAVVSVTLRDGTSLAVSVTLTGGILVAASASTLSDDVSSFSGSLLCFD